jgi:hypothetical protein
VLPPLPSLVIGRQEALKEIKWRLGIGGEMRGITVIQGWPGVGKSTTIAILAHDQAVAQQFPDGVLWASLGEQPSIISEISTWADALRLGEPSRVRKVEEISAQLTAVLRDKRMLLIIDDVWQAEHTLPFRVGGHLNQGEIEPARAQLREAVGFAQQLKSSNFLTLVLIPAMMLWRAEHQLEQAAAWAGLLMQHQMHVLPRLFKPLCVQLESDLGVERYERALEQGKALTLESTVVQIASALR